MATIQRKVKVRFLKDFATKKRGDILEMDSVLARKLQDDKIVSKDLKPEEKKKPNKK